MYENPLSYGEETDELDDPLFPQVDPVQRAAEEQRKKLKLEADAKAEKEAKEAKEAQKKADKEARLAQKLADKAAKKIEQKVNEVQDESSVAKEQVEDAKQTIQEFREAVADQVTELQETSENKPIEMNFTEGSEYISKLKTGEEAIFDLSQKTEEVTQTIELADEVTERAEALARARAALDEVVSSDIGIENRPLEVASEVFGADGPDQEVRERLRHAWEYTDDTSLASQETFAGTTQEVSDSMVNPPVQFAGSEQYAPLSSSPTEINSTPDMRFALNIPVPAEQEAPKRRNQETSSAFLGFGAGVLAEKARTTHKQLERVDSSLRKNTEDLLGELRINHQVESIQHNSEQFDRKPPAKREPQLPVESRLPEVKTGALSVIPLWVTQLEKDLKAGRAPELKRWQADVLKVQHPDLLTRYERLDGKLKIELKQQSRQGYEALKTSQATPGELPSFSKDPHHPAFMQPPVAPVNLNPMVRQSYTINTQPIDGPASALSNNFVSIVTIGGVVFGALLIALFGY